MRARRRQDEQRMKARAKRLVRAWSFGFSTDNIPPREVGRIASTHGRPCSCFLCRNENGSYSIADRRRIDSLQN